jgi:hypothetical protein
MGKQEVYRRSLAKARETVGGEAALARYLRSSRGVILAWLTGEEDIPDAVFLRVVDLLLDDLDVLQEHAAASARHVGQVARTRESRESKEP